MEYSCRRLRLVSSGFAFLLISFVSCSVWAQGLPQSPYGAPSVVRAGLDLAPSNPLGMPGASGGLPRGSDALNLSSRMFGDILPTIPGLEISYLHSFGEGGDSSRLLVDFVRPLRLGFSTTVYGEIHGIVHAPFQSWSSLDERIDLSVGGGYRRRFGDSAVAGVHGFYDATRGWDRWHSSASVGGFMAAVLPGNDAIDLTVNWYGGSNTGLYGVGSGAWGKGTFDGTITYYHELWDGGPDLQLALVGYRVDGLLSQVHLRERGYGAKMQVASRDGMFRGFYMYENDRLLSEIHTVGVYLNVGLRLENLLALESPIEKPTPIFSSPRNLAYWQNAATGAARHLKSNTLRVGQCHKGDCDSCWDKMSHWYNEFKKSYPNRQWPPCDDWFSYVCRQARSTSECTNHGCQNCLYVVHLKGDMSCISKMNIKWHWDPGCCRCDMYNGDYCFSWHSTGQYNRCWYCDHTRGKWCSGG